MLSRTILSSLLAISERRLGGSISRKENAAVGVAVAAVVSEKSRERSKAYPVPAAAGNVASPASGGGATSSRGKKGVDPPGKPARGKDGSTASVPNAAASDKAAAATMAANLGSTRSLYVKEPKEDEGRALPRGVAAASSAASANAVGHYPDYRERIIFIFQELADINHALGERYKVNSYVSAIDQLKRDAVFYSLPPCIPPPPSFIAGISDRGTGEGVMDRDVKSKRGDRVVVGYDVHGLPMSIPGVGGKLHEKVREILETGDLKELHKMKQKSVIKAIQELTQVHGFGPRGALELFKKYHITTVSELRALAFPNGVPPQGGGEGSVAVPSSGKAKAGIHVTEAQRIGLLYHNDILLKIPHAEGRLHEAFLKLRLRKYLGKQYELHLCGSFRRHKPFSGDIDVLVTRKPGARNRSGSAQGKKKKVAPGVGGRLGVRGSGVEEDLAPEEVLEYLIEALKKEKYIEATLAQGKTKFMGVCRLKCFNYTSDTAGAKGKVGKKYPARRIDVRYVDPQCFPAAQLYFTGSKNFNVHMRGEAIKKGFILNEYGLFKNSPVTASSTSTAAFGAAGNGVGRASGTAEMAFSQLKKFGLSQFYSGGGGKQLRLHDESVGSSEQEASVRSSATDDGKKARSASQRGKSSSSAGREQSNHAALEALWQEIESKRVKVKGERDIFEAIGMDYVQPAKRDI